MNPKLEKLFKLPLYQRWIILVVILCLIVGGFVWFLYLPEREELNNLRDRIATLEAKLQQDRQIARNLPKFKAEYEKMTQQLERALAELPDSKEIPTLLTNISSLAKDNGLEVLQFRPGGEVPRGFYAEVPVQLKLQGTYHQVALFARDVGNLSRIVNINNLALANPSPSGGETTLSVDALATTFRFLESSGK